jgi:hypothetical protein
VGVRKSPVFLIDRKIDGRFAVLTVVLLKIQLFWAFMVCQLIKSYQSFQGPYHVKLHGQTVHLRCLKLKTKEVSSFETSGAFYPTTQRNIQNVLNILVGGKPESRGKKSVEAENRGKLANIQF